MQGLHKEGECRQLEFWTCKSFVKVTFSAHPQMSWNFTKNCFGIFNNYWRKELLEGATWWPQETRARRAPQAPIYSSGNKIEHKRWTRVWEELVLLKMLMKIGLPRMRGFLVMMMALISPSRREVPPAESLHRRAKVLLPKSRLETAALPPESALSIFSRSKWLI